MRGRPIAHRKLIDLPEVAPELAQLASSLEARRIAWRQHLCRESEVRLYVHLRDLRQAREIAQSASGSHQAASGRG